MTLCIFENWLKKNLMKYAVFVRGVFNNIKKEGGSPLSYECCKYVKAVGLRGNISVKKKSGSYSYRE